MADTYTKIADLIDPEVMGDMVSARIPKKLRVAPFAKVDDTLAGVPGDTITVPAYAYIGDADIVAEGEAVTIEKMTTSTRKATVKKAMKGIGLTDEAVLSGYGNPVGEANTQLAMAIAAKIDNDCMDVLQTATLTYDGSAGIISYAGVVDAVDALQEEQATEKVIFVHPKQVTQLRKDAEFTSTDKYPANVRMSGEIGSIAGCRVVPSKKVPLVEVGSGKTKCYACPIIKLESRQMNFTLRCFPTRPRWCWQSSRPEEGDAFAGLRILYRQLPGRKDPAGKLCTLYYPRRSPAGALQKYV